VCYPCGVTINDDDDEYAVAPRGRSNEESPQFWGVAEKGVHTGQKVK